MTWWWLSFADARKPKGTQFLGGVIVEGKDFMAAVKAAHVYNINPGGEVQGTGPFGPSDSIGEELIKKYSNRLLTKEDCLLVDAEFRGHVQRGEDV